MENKEDLSKLYLILEWTHSPRSKLHLVGVANKLAYLSNLPPNIMSRLGSRSLVFKPYSSIQIKDIIDRKYNHQPFFNSLSLYWIKKICGRTCDLRKILFFF